MKAAVYHARSWGRLRGCLGVEIVRRDHPAPPGPRARPIMEAFRHAPFSAFPINLLLVGIPTGRALGRIEHLDALINF